MKNIQNEQYNHRRCARLAKGKKAALKAAFIKSDKLNFSNFVKSSVFS